MDEVEEKPKLMNEEETLNYVKANFTTNPKKLKKFIAKMAPLCERHVVYGFIQQTLSSKDPVRYVNKCFIQINEYGEIIKDLIETGHHGMLIIDEVIYPAKLDTRENWLKDRWALDDEVVIQHSLAQNWMKEHNRGEFHGKVVLFKKFGFTGTPREIHQQCVKDTTGLKRYPGTDFYT